MNVESSRAAREMAMQRSVNTYITTISRIAIGIMM